MSLIRKILGFLVLSWDKWTSPTPMERSTEQQAVMDDATKHLVLFQLEACPFCVKVRRQIRRQNLKIGLRDIGKDPTAARELVEGGKLDQVPALRIPKASAATGYEWLYESDAINAYLREMFPN